MYRFQNSNYLNAFIIVAIIVVLYIVTIYWRHKKLVQAGTLRLIEQQILGFIPARSTLKFTLHISALLLIILGCANLQKVGNQENVQRKGVDIIVALDVSKSMLANDVQPNRLTRAKQLIEKLTDKLQGNRIGLVVFAGKSYLQVPLTIDYGALKMLLQTVTPDMIPTQGTVIADAIDMADESFSKREKKYKSIIVISDGEDHDERALNAAQKASSEGVIIHTIGIGSPQGVTLLDAKTNTPKLDENGNPVISKLNESELKSIAAAGNGTYDLLNNIESTSSHLSNEINSMEQKNMGAIMFANYDSYFPYFMGLALILLIIDYLTHGAKRNKKEQPKILLKSMLILFILSSLSTSAFAQKNKKLINEGNEYYQQKKYKEASDAYNKAILKDTSNLSKSAYNLGNALYQQKQLDAARKAYNTSFKKSKNKNEKAQNEYNIGNTFMSEKKWEEAISSYKEALRKNPQDVDAKYNLSYAQQMLKKDNNDKKDDKKDNKKDEQKEQKEQKENENKEKEQKENEQRDNKENKPEDNKEQQQQQQQPSKLSEQQADQILNALQQEEKKLQEKKKKIQVTPQRLEKDW